MKKGLFNTLFNTKITKINNYCIIYNFGADDRT